MTDDKALRCTGQVTASTLVQETRDEACAELFDLVHSGAVEIHISRRFPPRDASGAYRAIESAQTTGSVLSVP